MIVLDASAAIDLLASREPEAAWVEERVFGGGESVHSPHLIDIEVATFLRRSIHRRELSEDRAGTALDRLLTMRLRRYPHVELLPRAWALRASVTVADGIYVALAEALEAPLITTDRKLARAMGHRARIEAP